MSLWRKFLINLLVKHLPAFSLFSFMPIGISSDLVGSSHIAIFCIRELARCAAQVRVRGSLSKALTSVGRIGRIIN